MSGSVVEPVKRQWKTMYDEAAENEPPPWAQPNLKHIGLLLQQYTRCLGKNVLSNFFTIILSTVNRF